ncbi:MAG: type II toxin-antitoxin system VapC family toxin [Pyrinomonadaceae bacterium MAG19_C2-C3]|nr:type II toxin-antitoxin system VapC family toxin [Pyrinomonadaceae bacterium MAG19_C2-C3]
MNAYFLDSSAVVKRYLIEAGSVWVRSLFAAASTEPLVIARITGAEVVAAITRRSRGGSIATADAAIALASFRQDIVAGFSFVEITFPLVASAMNLAEKHVLRGYDAVQLAALEASYVLAQSQTTLVFIAADVQLLNAAQAEGLSIENPNNH